MKFFMISYTADNQISFDINITFPTQWMNINKAYCCKSYFRHYRTMQTLELISHTSSHDITWQQSGTCVFLDSLSFAFWLLLLGDFRTLRAVLREYSFSLLKPVYQPHTDFFTQSLCK